MKTFSKTILFFLGISGITYGLCQQATIIQSSFLPKTVVTSHGLKVELLPIQEPSLAQQAICLLESAFGASIPGNVTFASRYKGNHYTWLGAQLCVQEKMKCVGVILFTKEHDQAIRLSFIIVDPSYRNQGIARALIEYLVESTQCPYLILHTALEAVPFYLKLGFSSVDGGDMYKAFGQPHTLRGNDRLVAA